MFTVVSSETLKVPPPTAGARRAGCDRRQAERLGNLTQVGLSSTVGTPLLHGIKETTEDPGGVAASAGPNARQLVVSSMAQRAALPLVAGRPFLSQTVRPGALDV
jgi:hypothetical protein